MIAMQYEVTLPADYDMTIIDTRVRTRGPSLDALPGLGLKAYCIRRRETGSTVYQYAPFYLWQDECAMIQFLAGDGFRALCDSFGRPPVRHWVGIYYQRGPDYRATPTTATRKITDLEHDTDVNVALTAARSTSEQRGLHSSALAIDPTSWQLVRFSLWQADAPADTGVRYEIGHLSRPMIDQL